MGWKRITYITVCTQKPKKLMLKVAATESWFQHNNNNAVCENVKKMDPPLIAIKRSVTALPVLSERGSSSEWRVVRSLVCCSLDLPRVYQCPIVLIINLLRLVFHRINSTHNEILLAEFRCESTRCAQSHRKFDLITTQTSQKASLKWLHNIGVIHILCDRI